MIEMKNEQPWTPIQNIDMHCFACGPENEHGLKMEFETNEELLRSRVIVPEHLRGWSNLVHGGIISTLIDETMSWAAITLLKRFILTKNMSVKFKKPVKINQEIVVYGRIVEQTGDKLAVMAAEIYDEAGDLCASGQGEFALFTTSQFAKLNLIKEDQLNDMVGALS